MAATALQLTQDQLKLSNLNGLKLIISTFLLSLVPASVFCLTDLAAYSFTYDLTTAGVTVLATDMIGLQYFTGLTKLNLLSFTISIPNGSIDITGFTGLTYLRSAQASGCPFRGDWSGFTLLTVIQVAIDSFSFTVINPPILANNPGLTSVSLTGGSINWGITNIGNLGALRNLTSYTLSSSAAGVTQATINNILSTLHTAKSAGCPLTVLNLSGTKAPTGGSSNADYTALVSAGVTVTLGVL